MTTVTWPSGLVAKDVTLGLKANTQVSVSDLSGYVQTYELPGTRWTMSFNMASKERDSAGAKIEAFIATLRGQAVRAQIPVFGRGTPRGTWGGAIVVDNEGAGSPTLSQTGSTLWVKGGTAGATCKAGDYFNLGSAGQLLMVTADLTLDGSGKGQLAVQPPIRSAPAQGVALVSSSPVVPYMILADPHQKWRIGVGDDNEYAFDFVELFA